MSNLTRKYLWDNSFMCCFDFALTTSNDNDVFVLRVYDLRNLNNVADLTYREDIGTFNILKSTYKEGIRKYKMLFFIERNKDMIFDQIKDEYDEYLKYRKKYAKEYSNKCISALAKKLKLNDEEINDVVKKHGIKHQLDSGYEYYKTDGIEETVNKLIESITFFENEEIEGDINET